MTEKSDISNLQAQISALAGIGSKTGNNLIEPDNIMSTVFLLIQVRSIC